MTLLFILLAGELLYWFKDHLGTELTADDTDKMKDLAEPWPFNRHD